jgi:hypothetical protein
MSRIEIFNAVGLFALVVMVAFTGTFGVSAAISNIGNESPSPDPAAYETDELLTTPFENDSTVRAPNTSERKTVIVDLSHGNAIRKNEMQPLIGALVRGGHDVRVYSGNGGSQSGSGAAASTSGMNDTLGSADALVIANPGRGYSTSERKGIEAFADAGGRVVVLADPAGQAGPQSSGMGIPVGASSDSPSSAGLPTDIDTQFGFSFGTGHLFDLGDNANNYKSIYGTPNSSGSLTAGVDRIVMREAAPIATDAGATSVIESSTARLSSTRRADQYTVVARTGNVTAVGDTSLVKPAAISAADNGQFVSNLAEFLVSGDKAAHTADTDAPGTEPSPLRSVDNSGD